MLLNDYRIIRPKSTKIQRKGKAHYVYQVVGQTYKPDKKYTVDKRVCIGKMIDEVYMIPNDKFQDYYPDLIISEVEPPALSDTLKVGMFTSVHSISQKLGITDLLASIFDDDHQLIIDLVSYMIVHESCTFQYYPQFMRNHPSLLGPRSDSTISSFLKNGISDENIKLFLSSWNVMHTDLDCVYVGYDSTNFNCAARGLELADYGHPKVDEGLPQINMSYMVNQEDSTPLYYELYDGSIIDNSQFSHMVEQAELYGYKNIGFLLDRGYCSKKNIDYMDRNGYQFILMMKESQQICREAIAEVALQLKGLEGYYIAEHGLSGTTIEKKLHADDKKTRYFHVYYDDVKAAEAKKVYLVHINKQEEEIQKKLEKKISRREDMGRYEKCFDLKYDDNGYLRTYRRRTKVIEEELKYKGFFVIISSEKLTAQKVLEVYRGRDNIEKMFRSLKSGIDFEKMRVHTDASVKSKVFITFLAMIIRNEIFQKAEELRKISRKEYTVPAIINELENVEVTRSGSKKYKRMYALTKKQKKMLSAFGLSEKDIDQMAASLNQKSASSA